MSVNSYTNYTGLDEVFHNGYLLPWERSILQKRILHLDRSGLYSAQMTENGMYDFQVDCVDWLRNRRLNGQGYNVIALDTGCGKTRTIGEFLKTMPAGQFALYISPGGLIRQTWKELGNAGESSQKAESSKEFIKVYENNPRIIVVNAAISQTWLPILHRAWYIILDEAHRFSLKFIEKISLQIEAYKLLFCTATPYGNSYVARLAFEACSEQIFAMMKSPSLMRAMHMPIVYMTSTILEAPPTEDLELFLTSLLCDHSCIYILLAIQTTERRTRTQRNHTETQLIKNVLEQAFQSLLHASSRRLFEVARRLKHPAFDLSVLEELPSIYYDERFVPLFTELSKDSKPHKNARPVCACCGLQEEEIQTLIIYQRRFLFLPKVPSPTDLFSKNDIFVRALLRLPSSTSVCSYSGALDEQTCKDIKVISVHSGLNAAQRGNRVQKFSQSRCPRIAIEMIRKYPRAICKLPPTLWELVFSFLADRSILIFDPRCGDVGYNLQCATHIISPIIPKTSQEALQICGRSCRISSLLNRSIEFCCLSRWSTGENLLFQHIQHTIQRHD